MKNNICQVSYYNDSAGSPNYITLTVINNIKNELIETYEFKLSDTNIDNITKKIDYLIKKFDAQLYYSENPEVLKRCSCCNKILINNYNIHNTN